MRLLALAPPLPCNRDGRGHPAPPVRELDDPRRLPAPARSSSPSRRTIRGRARRRSRSTRAPTPRGRCRSGSRAGRARATSTALRSQQESTHADREVAGRRPRRPSSSTSRRGSPLRIRGSTPFAGVSRSNAARSSTASSSRIYRPEPTWPTSPRPRRPSRSTAGRSSSSAAYPECRAGRASSDDLRGWGQREYRDLRELPRRRSAPAQLLAVPYFAWANRDSGGMRVWIPAAE